MEGTLTDMTLSPEKTTQQFCKLLCGYDIFWLRGMFYFPPRNSKNRNSHGFSWICHHKPWQCAGSKTKTTIGPRKLWRSYGAGFLEEQHPHFRRRAQYRVAWLQFKLHVFLELAFSSLYLNFCVCNCHWEKSLGLGWKPMWLHNIGREIQTDGTLAVTCFSWCYHALQVFFSRLLHLLQHKRSSGFLNFVDQVNFIVVRYSFRDFFKGLPIKSFLYSISIYIINMYFCSVVESLHLPRSTIDNMLWLKSRCPTLMIPIGSKMSLRFLPR